MYSKGFQSMLFTDAARLLAPSTGSEYKLDQREIEVHLRLHFPRTAHRSGTVEMAWAEEEAGRVAARMLEKRITVQHLLAQRPTRQVGFKELEVCQIDSAEARLISENFHYIAVHRSRSEHWVLRDPVSRYIYTYCCVSPVGFDGKRQSIANLLQCQNADIAVVSRVYSFSSGFRNSISFLLSRVAKKSAIVADARWLVTTVDPNLGFTGTSYVACNWRYLHRLPRQPYTYFEGNFTTHAQLELKFGTTDRVALKARLGERFEVSKCQLAGQVLFGLSLRKFEMVHSECS